MSSLTTTSRPVKRLITRHERKDQRSTFGTLEDAYDDAMTELANGRIANAIALLREAFSQGLRRQYLSASHKEKTSLERPEDFLQKLRSMGVIDGWTFQLLTKAIKPIKKGDVCAQHADFLLIIVKTYCFYAPATSIEPGSTVKATDLVMDPAFSEWL